MYKQLRFLTTMLLLAVCVGTWAEPVTVTSTTFSRIYGSVGSDENVTFTSYQGGGTTAPGVYSNAIRLYQNSSGATGGYVVINVPEGYVITSATIQSTNNTTTGYMLTDTNPETTPAKNTFNVNNYSLNANTDYTVSGISTRYITFACFGNSNSTRLNISKISITYQETGGSQTETCETPTFSPAAGTYTEAQRVSISTATVGATIYYTTDGAAPTTNSSVYSSAINVSSTTTIKAMAVKEGMSNSDVAEATYKINTQNQTTITAGSLTHVTINELWDGDFNSITLGDNVSEGTLVYFTFNIDNGYTLESITVKDANDNEVSITENTGSWSFTMPNTSVTINATATLETVKTLQSIAVTTPPSKVVYEVGENFNPAGMVVTATYDDNTTAAITGYTFTPNTALTTDITEVTISYTENNVTKTATQTITVNEVVDYVILPFSWAGGASNTLTAINGVSAHGLGSDYNSIHNPYNVKFDNDGDYILIKTNAQPGKVTIGVKMIGGASTSSITVQGSADGNTFTDVQELTISGVQNDVITLETTKSFAATDRYVRLLFTKGSNVGVGAITIANASTDPVINAANSVELTAEATTGEIEYTISNPVGGTSLTAAEKTDVDWISDVTVATDKVTFTTTVNTGSERTATITLTYGEVSKDVTVTQDAYVAPVIPTGNSYVKVASTDDITTGQYLIVYEDGNIAFDGSRETLDAIGNTIEITINDNKIAATTATEAAEFTIDVTAGTIKSASGKYIGVSTNNNGLKQTDNASTYTNSFSIDTNGNAVITAVFNQSEMTLRYNDSSNQERFRYYRQGQQAIQLYKKVATITLNAACTDGEMVYGTYSNTSAFVVSNDIVVAEVGIVDGKLRVEEYETGAVVPANTGVMVSALGGGDYTVTLTDEEGTSVLGANNNLRPTGDGITADTMAKKDPACKYYRLTMHKGEQIGFWWGAPDGAAFSVGANKAYLAVPVNQAKDGFAFGNDGDATSISTIDNGQLTMKNAYNLQGQKVGSEYKGIVIVNGKKFINK